MVTCTQVMRSNNIRKGKARYNLRIVETSYRHSKLPKHHAHATKYAYVTQWNMYLEQFQEKGIRCRDNKEMKLKTTDAGKLKAHRRSLHMLCVQLAAVHGCKSRTETLKEASLPSSCPSARYMTYISAIDCTAKCVC